MNTYTRNSTVGDLMEDLRTAAIVTDLVKLSPFGALNGEEEGAEMLTAFLKYLPLRGLAAFSGGKLTDEMLNSMLMHLNWKIKSSNA
ncbi:hypothetical protein HQN89_29965 [Paenibacillus frigoriresistens]|uniref:hypothetical protein n=1 Tax=Paenibacillus alginolyticus TaxID=59839 RepID=UPI00156575AB|nr:hypothetical protein [Paenibacillus frigoriresistens]NRF95117.1 hypothetical protein [Paenibacillus frigoriresistens]